MDPKFISKVKLNKQGQLTLPLEARKELGIDIDADLYWYTINDSLIVTTELMSEKEVAKRLGK